MPTICPTCNGDEEIESCPTHGGTNCPCVHAVEPCTDCLDGTTSEDTNDA